MKRSDEIEALANRWGARAASIIIPTLSTRSELAQAQRGRLRSLPAMPCVQGRVMEFDNSFEVPLPPADAWKVLMDIRRIAPCMPGAELTDVVDERTYKGRIGVRLGPVALTFAGTVKFEEINAANRTARVAAQGSDAKGRGAATAAAAFRLEPADGSTAASGTRVLVHTNLALSGAVAQYGRGVGIIQLTAAQIVNQFAANLKAQLAKDNAATAAGSGGVPDSAAARETPVLHGSGAAASAAKPISGFTLIAQLLWSLIARLFGRR
jgi:carbon monoxide dehydrogenase subunit G